jgi:hypothetical protein
MAADIQIERVEVDVVSNGQTYTLANDVGNVENAFVRIVGPSIHSSAGPTDNTGNAGPDEMGTGVLLTGTNQLTFYKNASTGPTKMMVEVWRYVGAAGGPNEFINRASSSVVLANGDSSVSVALVVGDRNKVVPIHSGFVTTDTSVSNMNAYCLAMHLDLSGDLEISRNNTGKGADVTVYYQAVEFTGSAWGVGHARSTSHNTASAVQMRDDSLGYSFGNAFDVVDWSNAMILETTMEGDSARTGLSDMLLITYPDVDTDKVTFNLNAVSTGASNNGYAYAHIIRHDDLVVSRDSNLNIAEGNGSYGASIPLPAGVQGDVAFNEMSLEWTSDSSGTGTAHGRGYLHAKIDDDVAVQTYADGDTFNATEYDASLYGWWEFDVEFPVNPEGILVETGGTGFGMMIGFNTAGEFVVRGGSGSAGSPSNCARIVVPASTYDFSGKTGRLRATINPATNTAALKFDNGDTGTWDYETSAVAVTSFSSWSGGAGGMVGGSDGTLAGLETSTYDFNGVISEMRFKQLLVDYIINHWVHRSGNLVGAYYGVADLSNLTPAVGVDIATLNTKTPAQIDTINGKTTAQIDTINGKTI